MPKKRKASEAEVAALAKQFRGLWHRGEELRPWLRQHRPMVLALVHSGCTWDTLARAFSKARIKYRDGNGADWHGEGLRREFVRAALPLNRDKNRTIVIDESKSSEALIATDEEFNSKISAALMPVVP